jgi:tyrosine decarboxylase / aspartate 1-decarboxylase
MPNPHFLSFLPAALGKLNEGFAQLPDFEATYKDTDVASILSQVAERMQDNYPYFHPLYAGQMLKPPHPVAQLAYMLAMYINPNNHALDGGRASSEMEKEAVKEIAAMYGWKEYVGHLTGGGTMANLEALWVAGKYHPKKYIVASEFAHYTHERISDVLRLKFRKIKGNGQGQIDLIDLEKQLQKGNIGTVVATAGTTGIGGVDDIPAILALKEKYDFRLHIDAAYGGYFILSDQLSTKTTQKFAAITQADSIVIDPHKQGLQPYGCGCVLFKNPSVGGFYKHNSPYTYFSSSELHLGEISLECSRPGAAAVALWATQQLLPLQKGGEFAQNLSKNRAAALAFYDLLQKSERFFPILAPELDIVIYAQKGKSLSEISQASQRIFEAVAKHDLHLALFQFPTKHLSDDFKGVKKDQKYLTCLRSSLMKPEHLAWIGEIMQILEKC